MKLISKSAIREILGQIPLTAEVYGMLRRPGKSLSADFALDQLDQHIVEWKTQAAKGQENS